MLVFEQTDKSKLTASRKRPAVLFLPAVNMRPPFRGAHFLRRSGKPKAYRNFGKRAFLYRTLQNHADVAAGFPRPPCPEFFLVRAGCRLYRREIIPAKAQGLCAAVYTQLSDVEDEQNGILTYDRAVCKLPKAEIAAINEILTKGKD